MDSSRKFSVRFSQMIDDDASSSRPSQISEQKSLTQKEEVGEVSKPIDIYNDPLYNKDRTRNTNIPYELFVERKQKEFRDKEKMKRKVRVSAITDKDLEVYEEAIEKLQDQIEEAKADRMKYLWNLERSRAKKALERPQTRAAGDDRKYPCRITYSTTRPRQIRLKKILRDYEEPQSEVEDEFKDDNEPVKTNKLVHQMPTKLIHQKSNKSLHQKVIKLVRAKSTSTRQSRSKVSLKGKKKEEQIIRRRTPKNKPIIRLPPLKFKPWKPPQKAFDKIVKVVKEDGEVEFIRPLPKLRKPRFPTINYPKLITKKWEPPKSDVIVKEKKVVNIQYPPLKMRKTPWRPVQKKPVKKPRILIAPRKFINPIPRIILPKRWNYFDVLSPKMQILPGTTSQYSKKFSFISNGKQSAFIACAALTKLKMIPTRAWTQETLDEIILYGDINFRRQMRHFKRQFCIKPLDIEDKITMKHAKVRITIGQNILRGFHDPEDLKEIVDRVDELLNNFSGVIFFYNNRSYAIWKEENGFFIFNSEDTNDDGRLVAKNKGACCAIRSTSLETIIEYLESNFRANKQIYEIYSFSVDDIVTIEQGLRKYFQRFEQTEQKKPVKKKQKETIVEVHNMVSEEPEDHAAEKPTEKSKPGISAILFHHQPEPTFGHHFQSSSLRDHCFLTSEFYLDEANKIRAPFISSVAIVMLRICKSFIWTSATIGKIFKYGHLLYAENVESVILKNEKEQAERLKLLKSIKKDESSKQAEDSEQTKLKPIQQFSQKQEIAITDTHPVVTIGKLKLVLSVENIIVGRMLARNSSELSLQTALDNLFKHYDFGLIIAHDVVAVWREQNHYFMFDPNQCDQFRRASDDEEMHNSCLNCFKNSADLVKLYIENLPKDQRNSVFKICKIDTSDFVEKSTDWQNFKAIGDRKWILNAHISETSEEFNVDNRNNQSLCIALATLARTRELGVMHWNSNIIDEVIRLGDEFYTGCVMALKEKGEFKDASLKLSDTLKELKLEKNVVDFYYEEDVVNGSMESKSLYEGLKAFFANDDLAVVNFLGNCMAVFRHQDAFYLFDSKPRNEEGKNFKIADPLNSCTYYGTACLLRVTCLCNLANHIILNAELADSSTFSIAKVEISVRSTSQPCYFNYTPCENIKYGAMLRAANDYHEDREQFKCNAVEKTLCNLLSCLCFTKVLNPRNWASHDINEMMKIGLKLFCKIAEQTDAMWSILEMVDICSIKLKIMKHEDVNGIFARSEAILPAITEEQLEEKTHISNAELIDGDAEMHDDAGVSEQRSSLFPHRPTQLTLIEILQSMDGKVEFHAILFSSLFNVAIFKINKFYYIFDPKESNGNGKLVRWRLENFIERSLIKERDLLVDKFYQSHESKRISQEEEFKELLFGRPVVFGKPTIKPSQMRITIEHKDDDDEETEEPVNVCDRGSAYVSWFTSLDLLCSHLVNKIPEKFRSESFVINHLDIIHEKSNDTAKLEQWHNFEPITNAHWIIRGSFSQNDSSQFLHRHPQDSANCVMALIFNELCNDDEWNSTVLDVILNLGDRLHRKSAAKHDEHFKLKINDLDMPIFIRPFIINIAHELVKHDFIIKKDDKVPLESFKMAFKNFMDENRAAILVSKDYHVAVWRNSSDESLMMFDPHDIGPDGLKKSTGVACLQRFMNHSNLIDIFVNNVKDIDGLNEYYLIKITVTMNKHEDNNEYPELPIISNQKVKTIRGKEIQVKSPGNIQMSIYHAIASISLSHSLDSEYYTPDIIDKIIMLGNELMHECKTSKQFCFKDFDINRKSACPDEISWNFTLHDTFASVQIDIFQRGVISKNLCPLPNLMFALEEFFTFHKTGVLITNDFIAAIWKENCDYLIFYSCKIDESGRVAKSGQPGVVIFKSVHELYSNVISNVQNGSFELRICDIKLSDKVIEHDTRDNCNQKNKPRKEEIIMPAVAYRSKIDISEKSVEIINGEEDDEELKEIIQRSGKSLGFIEFSRSGFLYGRLSKNSKSFSESSRKFHSSAICIASAAMNSIKNMNCWNSDIIDQVIVAGNSIYIESSIICGTVEVVEITKLVSLIFMADREIETKVESCFEFAHESLNLEQLRATFTELLSCYGVCYLKKSWDCWTIVKNAGFYYLFDPLGIEVSLKKVNIHRPILYRFDCLVTLLEEFLKISRKQENQANIEIGGIIVTPKHHVKEEQHKPRHDKKKPLCPEIERKSPPLMPVPDLPEDCDDYLTCSDSFELLEDCNSEFSCE